MEVEKFIDTILCRCLTLEELLSLNEIDDIIEVDLDLAENRLDAWIKARGLPHTAFFKELHANYGASEVIRRKLGATRINTLSKLEWYVNCHQVARHLLEQNTDSSKNTIVQKAGVPFANLLNDIVKFAREKLVFSQEEKGFLERNPSVLNGLLGHLLTELGDTLSLVLYEETSQTVSVVNPRKIEELDQWRPYGTGSAVWAGVFKRRPVSLRRIGSIMHHWSEFAGSLVSRLTQDWEVICAQALNINPQCAKITSIEYGLSDPHNGGQTVVKFCVNQKLSFLYKPRNLGNDIAWSELVSWLRLQGLTPLLRVPRVIHHEDYGWVEFITRSEPSTDEEVRHYFQSAGSWSALLYLLNTRDIHEENVIASNRDFIPIDLEASLSANERYPRVSDPRLSAVNLANEKLEDSIAKTGILPNLQVLPDGKYSQIGALSVTGPTLVSEIIWNEPDGAKPWPEISETIFRRKGGLPIVDGEEVSLFDFQPEYIRGLRSTLECVLNSRKEIVAKYGPLNGFDRGIIRRIPRSTAFYATISGRLKDLRNWDDGAKWSAQLKFIDRFPDLSSSVQMNKFVRRSEDLALLNGDVPWFSHDLGAIQMTDGTEGIDVSDALVSGLDISIKRIESLNVKKIHQLENEVELTILAAHLEAGNETPSLDKRDDWRPRGQSSECDPQSVFDTEIHRIRALVSDTALIEDASASWTGMTSQSGHAGSSVGQIGHSLYSGQTGVAIFLAAYAKEFDCAESRLLAHKALNPIRFLLNSNDGEHLSKTIGLHGLTGVSGIIYALCTVGALLAEEELVQASVSLARKYYVNRSGGLIGTDLMSGGSGTILALSKIFEISGDYDVLELIKGIGERSVWSQEKLNPLGHSKSDFIFPILSGLSHGIAGMSLASSTAMRFINDPVLEKSILLLNSVESERYSASQKNWPDLRASKQNSSFESPCQWCHGAVGIGLSRLSTLRTLATSKTAKMDVERAVQSVISRDLRQVDHLCCGNFGQTEFLFDAATFFQCDDLKEQAFDRMVSIIKRSHSIGSYAWPVGRDQNNLGFFVGSTGVGYSLLRTKHPTKLPSILTMQ